MSLTGAVQARYGGKESKATWKTIAKFLGNGRVLFDDGTTGTTLSIAALAIGDRVLVLDGQVLRFKWEDVKPVFPELPAPVLVVCYIGNTTGQYEKKFFALRGSSLAEISYPSGWQLTDDGRYGYQNLTVFGIDDPSEYDAVAVGDGLGIPAVYNGISAKQQNGRAARYVLNQSMEDDPRIGHQVIYQGGTVWVTVQAVAHSCSLLWQQYRRHLGVASAIRYTPEGIIAMWDRLSGVDKTVVFQFGDATPYTSLHRDVVQVINKIFSIDYSGNKSSVTLENDGMSDSFIVAGARDGSGRKQRIIRAAFPLVNVSNGDFFGSAFDARNFGAFTVEEYDADTGAVDVLETFRRDIAGDTEDYTPSDLTAGFLNLHPSSRYDFNLASDVKLVAGIGSDGKQTYLRIQNDTAYQTIGSNQYRPLNAVNVGIYCADELVEESGMLETVKVSMPFANPAYWPIVQRNFNILHVHQDENFRAVLYRRIDYVSHQVDGLAYRDHWSKRIDRLQVVTQTTYWISVNGVKMQLSGECINREYLLNNFTDTADGSSPHCYWVHSFPWVDIGYDDLGVDTGENNVNLTRIFTTATRRGLLVGYDAFPIRWRHDIERQGDSGSEALVPVFDTGVVSYPPSCDADYADVQDRKWLLFDISGSLTAELDPPQKAAGGHIPRINGLAMLDPMD